jgi:hypothetical protein
MADQPLSDALQVSPQRSSIRADLLLLLQLLIQLLSLLLLSLLFILLLLVLVLRHYVSVILGAASTTLVTHCLGSADGTSTWRATSPTSRIVIASWRWSWCCFIG